MKRDSAINMLISAKLKLLILMAMGVCSVPSTKLHLSPTRFSQNMNQLPSWSDHQRNKRKSGVYISPDSTPGGDFWGVFRDFACCKQGCISCMIMLI